VRCGGWQPSQVTKGSGDNRILGIQVTKILVKATGQAGTPGNGNTASGW
jgi:hypothetical protein